MVALWYITGGCCLLGKASAVFSSPIVVLTAAIWLCHQIIAVGFIRYYKPGFNYGRLFPLHYLS